MTTSPYYDQGGITLYLGDCREILPELRADIVITDPPYNAGKRYGPATDDRQPWRAWVEWFDGCLDGMCAAAPNVLSFLSQPAYRHYLRLGRHEVVWTAVWVKPLALSTCAAPFLPHWEPIVFWGSARKGRHGRGTLWGADVFTHNVETGRSRFGHPTPKPFSLMCDLVGRTDGVVLDPFAGSGTTLAAAKRLGRRAIGVEINEFYAETIVSRLAQEVLPLAMGMAQLQLDFQTRGGTP